MDLIQYLKDAISGIFTVDALRERLALAVDRIESAQKENSDLKQELAQAQTRIANLEKQLGSNGRIPAGQFVEEAGALFKRDPRGGFFDVVFCPRCPEHSSTSSFPPGEQFNCSCGWFSNFTEHDLPAILERVRKNY